VRPTVLTLDGCFDAAAAASLRARLAEPKADLAVGLVVDLRPGGVLDAGQQQALIRTVAVAPPDLALAAIVDDPGALDQRAGSGGGRVRLRSVATYADAVLALRDDDCGHADAPFGGDDLATRHHRVVRKALHWAERSAQLGDLADALGWLELARAVNGRLPGAWEMRRRRWEQGWHPPQG
jgi:hypothetical protein